jgi:glyceraldehyde-3-phosphate dehydrogenase (NAD(P))
MLKVGIAGYGTIGKRVADAVNKSDDMELMGVTKTKPDYGAYIAKRMRIKIYAHSEEDVKNFQDNGFKIEGTLKDLLPKIDIIVDTAPGKKGLLNKTFYEKAGIKMIFQGGEKANVAEVSFNSQANYDEAWGKNSVRVVSCNTTGLSRVLGAVDNKFGIKQAKVVLIRRVADPKEMKGFVDAIEPVLKIPSHHGPDLNTVLPHIPIESLAVAVPTTLMHLHTLMIELKDNASRQEVLNVLKDTPRIILVKGSHNILATNVINEIARDLGRPRNDFPEVVMWDEGINVKDGWCYLIYAVHQESIVQPENIDAIRSMNKMLPKKESIQKTDKTLGLVHGYLF